MAKYPELTEVALRQLVEEGLSVSAIAAKFGCSRPVVARRLDEYGIPRRRHDPLGEILPEEQLRDLYLRQGLSCKVISDMYGLKGGQRVRALLYRYGIVRRPRRAREQDKRGSESHRWRGVGKLSGSKWCVIRGAARIRSLDFAITIEYAWELFEKQQGRCALSGVPITLEESVRSRLQEPDSETASLDRIDSSQGYLVGNVQWVHKTVNRMKMHMSDEDFKEWCRMVAEFSNEKTNLGGQTPCL